jgi:hypothetical protein
MKFRAVGCSVAVDERFVVDANGVDNERIVFIVANGLAIP